MSAFKEEIYRGLCVYNYSQKVANLHRNNGRRYKMLFCIALPTENKEVKGHTLVSGFDTIENAKRYIDAHHSVLIKGFLPRHVGASIYEAA